MLYKLEFWQGKPFYTQQDTDSDSNLKWSNTPDVPIGCIAEWHYNHSDLDKALKKSALHLQTEAMFQF